MGAVSVKAVAVWAVRLASTAHCPTFPHGSLSSLLAFFARVAFLPSSLYVF